MLDKLSGWANQELTGNILPFWESQARDRQGEGFLGEIGPANEARPEVERSVVMVARQLWTFAAAARYLNDLRWLQMARAAHDYLINRFLDTQYGGFFWSVKPDGSPAVVKKQSYGQAFAIYGLAELARCPLATNSERQAARHLALEVFSLLENYVHDPVNQAYFEARARDWQPTADRLLSPADLDCDKSMNTNLHILEAYSNLLRLEDRPDIAAALYRLLDVFVSRIVAPDGHLGLFFTADWSRLDTKVSYGHDIEASWLIEEAVGLLDKPAETETTERQLGLARAKAATASLAESSYTEGWDPLTGGLEEASDSAVPGAERDTNRIWWCQAEAVVGFLAAWQRTAEVKWLEAAYATSVFIQKYIKDPLGDWRWGVSADGQALAGLPKGGNWKTGYHNGRMCLEIIERLKAR